MNFFKTHEIFDAFRSVPVSIQLSRELATARRSLLSSEHHLEELQASAADAFHMATIHAESAKGEEVRVELLKNRIRRLEAHSAHGENLELGMVYTDEVLNVKV